MLGSGSPMRWDLTYLFFIKHGLVVTVYITDKSTNDEGVIINQWMGSLLFSHFSQKTMIIIIMISAEKSVSYLTLPAVNCCGVWCTTVWNCTNQVLAF